MSGRETGDGSGRRTFDGRRRGGAVTGTSSKKAYELKGTVKRRAK
jgi:hypothetical protein